eukprot:122725-Amphidinium_carterae.2
MEHMRSEGARLLAMPSPHDDGSSMGATSSAGSHPFLVAYASVVRRAACPLGPRRGVGEHTSQGSGLCQNWGKEAQSLATSAGAILPPALKAYAKPAAEALVTQLVGKQQAAEVKGSDT